MCNFHSCCSLPHKCLTFFTVFWQFWTFLTFVWTFLDSLQTFLPVTLRWQEQHDEMWFICQMLCKLVWECSISRKQIYLRNMQIGRKSQHFNLFRHYSSTEIIWSLPSFSSHRYMTLTLYMLNFSSAKYVVC